MVWWIGIPILKAGGRRRRRRRRGGGTPRAAGNPDDRNGTKLSGKEPAIFDGDRSKAEAFLLEWTIYRLLNGEQDIMRQPFSRVMLFLTFIKGPNVQEWAGSQVAWVGSRLLAGVTAALPLSMKSFTFAVPYYFPKLRYWFTSCI